MSSRRKERWGGLVDSSQPFSVSCCCCAPNNGVSACSFNAKSVLTPS